MFSFSVIAGSTFILAVQANYVSDPDTLQQQPGQKGSFQATVQASLMSLASVAVTEGQPGVPMGWDLGSGRKGKEASVQSSDWLGAAGCGQGRAVRTAGTLGARPPCQGRPGKLQRELATAEHLQQEGQVHGAINVQFICDCEQHTWDVTADCRVKQPAELGCFGGSSRL